MSRFSDTTDPVRSAGYIGSFNSTAAPYNTTDWVDVTSATVINSITGSALAAGKLFTVIQFHNSGAATMYLKLRARTLPGDATAGEISIPAGLSWSAPIAGLVGSSPVTIAIKKGAAGDDVHPLLGLEEAP
tara:strand:- start:76 stop:468 length:393 start_codon:yes stop_codon:yes gene_type:complete